MRESFLWRRAALDWRQAGPISEDGPRERTQALRVLLTHELAATARACATAWRREVEGAALLPTLVLNAHQFKVSARICARERHQPVVEVALGTLLAIDDLALYAACAPLFLAPDAARLRAWARDPEARRARFFMAGTREGEAPGFRDYEALMRAGPERMVFAMPRAPWRLRQASALSDLMLAFVMLHERAHFALGHLDALGEMEGVDAESGLGAIETGRGAFGSTRQVRAADRRMFELEADAMAFFVLFAYARASRRIARRARWGGREQADGRLCDVRLCLTASMLACFLFHLRVNPDPLQRDPAYPSPQARMMHLMMCALSLAGVRAALAGASQALPSARMGAMFALTLQDLCAVSELYGGELSPLAAGEGVLRPADWVRDVAVLCRGAGADKTALRTAAGLEILALAPCARRWRAPLRAWQVRRFGRETRLRLSGHKVYPR